MGGHLALDWYCVIESRLRAKMSAGSQILTEYINLH